MSWRIFLVVFMSVWMCQSPVQADEKALCLMAASKIEQERRLPKALLQAIALTESGRFDRISSKRYAWPWTVNSGGKGYFLDNKQEAIELVEKLKAQGKRNIDVGCMQVNLHYHPDAFANLDHAFDPLRNAHYAGRFLDDLRQETGTWAKAVERYHSSNRRRGHRYRSKVNANWRSVRKGDVVDGDLLMAGQLPGDWGQEEATRGLPTIMRGQLPANRKPSQAGQNAGFGWLTASANRKTSNLVRPAEAKKSPQNDPPSRSASVEPAAGLVGERPSETLKQVGLATQQDPFPLIRGIELATRESLTSIF
jgi:hypothetical protein